MNKRLVSLIAALVTLLGAILAGAVLSPEDEARIGGIETAVYGLGTPHPVFQTATVLRQSQTPHETLSIPTYFPTLPTASKTTIALPNSTPPPPANFPTPTPDSLDTRQVVEVTANPCLNVRLGPDLRAPVANCAARGLQFTVRDSKGGFAQADNGQFVGLWLSWSYLRIVS